MIAVAVIKVQDYGNEAKYVQEIEQSIERYLRQGLQTIIEKIQNKQFFEANQLILENLGSKRESYYGRLNFLLEKIVDYNDEEALDLFDLSEIDYQSTLNLEVILAVMGMLIGFVLSALIIRNIDRAVKELHDVSLEYAQGNLSNKVHYNSDDELGRVSRVRHSTKWVAV